MRHSLNRFFKLAFCAILVISIATACAAPTPAPPSALELLDLGERYLLELDYEQAVVQFLAVIEIEPLNARAYIGAAEAYIALGDTEAAIAVLERGYEASPNDPAIADMLAGLRAGLNAEEPNAEVESNTLTALQGEHIEEVSEFARYQYFLVDGVPQPMGTSEQSTAGGTITETIMAYMSSRSSVDEEWDEWRVAPHYWAGLSCTDCGEDNADGSMPEWFQNGFSHAWSGEWRHKMHFYEDFSSFSNGD